MPVWPSNVISKAEGTTYDAGDSPLPDSGTPLAELVPAVAPLEGVVTGELIALCLEESDV